MARRPRFSRHSSILRPSRTPNGPGAGVFFRDIELQSESVPFDVVFVKGEKGEVNVHVPIESMTLESAYDSVDCPHGFDYYASGGDKAIAGTLACSFNIVPILYAELLPDKIEQMDDALDRGNTIVVKGYVSFTDLGKPVYGAGWSRSRLSAGDGPTATPSITLDLDVFAKPRRGQKRELFRATLYEAFDCDIQASKETVILYGTLDEQIYAVTSDEGYAGPFVGDEADAEAEFDTAVREGHANVALVLVDRNGDPYEVLKRANSDRTSNPRRPRRPRR